MLAEQKTTSVVAAPLRAVRPETPNSGRAAAVAEPSTTALRPEAQLILLCARSRTGAPTAEKIKTLLRLDLDWEYIVTKAHEHCVAPLVYRTLDTVCRLGVPKDVFAGLRRLVEDNTRFNLYRTAELVKLVRLLSDAGISAVPFKGPVLSVLVYENLALRQYGDLDLLVRPGDVAKTQDLLVANGYNLVASLRRTQTNSRFRPRNKDLIFENATHSVRLELHWRLTGRHFGFPLDLNQLWRRLETVTLAGVEVPTLGPEDLLLYLCMHGSRHGWERVIWICDVAELVRAHSAFDWEHVASQASSLGSQRMLALGLVLARNLLDAKVPAEAWQWVPVDEVIESLAVDTGRCIFEGQEKDLSYWRDLHLRLRERRLERLRLRVYYNWRYLRLAVIPNERDHSLLVLSAPLSFLYYVLRPLRLLKEFGLPRVRKMARRITHPTG